jgi:hypothetical protein
MARTTVRPGGEPLKLGDCPLDEEERRGERDGGQPCRRRISAARPARSLEIVGAVALVGRDSAREIGEALRAVLTAREPRPRQISRGEAGPRIAGGTNATAPSRREEALMLPHSDVRKLCIRDSRASARPSWSPDLRSPPGGRPQTMVRERHARASARHAGGLPICIDGGLVVGRRQPIAMGSVLSSPALASRRTGSP